MNYMMIHIFLIFAMNNITTSLEFMRNTEVALCPKMIFLVASFLLLFGCLFLLLTYAKPEMRRCGKFVLRSMALSLAFVVLMLALRENMRLNILTTVAYVAAQAWMLYRFSRQGASRS